MSTTTDPVVPVTGDDLRDVERLVLREARLLDEERLEAWLELLADDVEVVVPVGPSTRPTGEELTMVRDDKFATQARVWRVQQTGMNHSQDPPSRMVRAVSNVEVEGTAVPGELDVAFVCVLHTWRAGGQRPDPMYTLPMRCEYRVRRDGDRWWIVRRQLNLLLRDGTLPPMTFLL